MTADSVVYYLNRAPANEPVDEMEWLFSALGQYTAAELRELLYVAQESEFFELMRGVFALSDESRSVLQKFLASADPRPSKAVIDPDGRCILYRQTPGRQGKNLLKIVG
jgi:hypothetical protein